jgi:uncharacterized protein YbaR (Trm112 family)
MQLKNPFPQEVRLLYLYEWQCRLCGSNGSGCLELHHIMGRISCSVFNSFLICPECHGNMCHSQEEEQKLFAKTFMWCYNIGYKPNHDDLKFIEENYERLFTKDLKQWLSNLNLKNKNP